jgi:hypothetical protein
MPNSRSESLSRSESGGDVLWRGDSRHESDVATEPAAMATLAAAVALARDGNYLAARRMCATVVFQSQPLIASRPSLLRATLHALLVTHGFRLLSRVIIAITGYRVDVTLLPEPMGAVEQPRRHDEARRICLLVDPRWLDDLSLDDGFLVGWCKELTAREPGSIGMSGLSPDPRQLEPI